MSRLYEVTEEQNPVQAWCDEFYMKNGPCCAGCDWWQGAYFQFGECTRTEPVTGHPERWSLVHGGNFSCFDVPETAGHIMTPLSHHCGEFKDEFDWQSLDTRYLHRIGFVEHRGVVR